MANWLLLQPYHHSAVCSLIPNLSEPTIITQLSSFVTLRLNNRNEQSRSRDDRYQRHPNQRRQSGRQGGYKKYTVATDTSYY